MSQTPLKIGFMGTPEFSVAPLKALHKSAHEITCVYSQPPRPKGRGHKVQLSPVHAYAEENDIPVFTPKSLKGKEEQAQFAAHNLDVAVVVAYGLLLPPAILEAPKYGCINIHASILPRWRGASPIQQAIWADDKETGVALMFMDKGLDTGPVITEEAIPIKEYTTAQSLHDELSILGSDMIVKAIDRLARDGHLPSTPQNNEKTTYAPLLKKEDGLVNWALPALSIDCQVRALNPWPGVYTNIHEKRFKILEAARTSQTHDTQPGTVLDKAGHIACGDGSVIKLIRVQPDGSKPMDFASALNGNHVAVNDIFS